MFRAPAADLPRNILALQALPGGYGIGALELGKVRAPAACLLCGRGAEKACDPAAIGGGESQGSLPVASAVPG